MRRGPRRRTPNPREDADRELAARLSELEDKLAAASTALRKVAMAQTSAEVIRARYREVTEAYDAVIAAADAGYRLAVGPTDGLSHTRAIAARGPARGRDVAPPQPAAAPGPPAAPTRRLAHLGRTGTRL